MFTVREGIIFFFNDTATTEIYTLSLHDALPIYYWKWGLYRRSSRVTMAAQFANMEIGTQDLRNRIADPLPVDRKSTRLNSSHANISYAVFCLKKTYPHHFLSNTLHPTHILTLTS